MARQPMPISSRWLQGAVLTYLVGFTVLGVLAYLVYRDQPPIPERVVAGDKVLFTRDDIVGGMHVFQRYGLMEYGSFYGHGAYLGPDFTAEYLHMSAEFLIEAYAGALAGGLSARERVAVELHENTYNPAEGSLIWSTARGEAHRRMVDYYRSRFYAKHTRGGAQAEWRTSADDVHRLTAFFAWTAWTAAADRPGYTYSYTNNWPPESLAGNFMTADAMTWSVISIIGLLGGTGVILYCFGRYDWLGWSETEPHRSDFVRSIKWPSRRPSEPSSGFCSSRRCCSSCRPSPEALSRIIAPNRKDFSASMYRRSCRLTSCAPGTSSWR
jgi:nitric oxide reductase subunit B